MPVDFAITQTRSSSAHVHLITRISLSAAAIALGSCSLKQHKSIADKDVATLLADKAARLNARIEDWRVERGENSRYHDGASEQVHPPMPEDDPISHQLMEEVDGKEGAWAGRGRVFDGTASLVAPGEAGPLVAEKWLERLPRSPQGEVVLTLQSVLDAAINNSRDYQREREDLFLSALDVSVERRAFNVLFNLGTTGSLAVDGVRKANRPDGKVGRDGGLDSTGGFSTLTGTGATILANMANQLIWNLDDPGIKTATSLFDFSIVQPLLRFGGRARALESLTFSERQLLANLRRMEQYQQSFFLRVTAGRTAGGGPERSSGQGSALGSAASSAVLAGSPSGRIGAPRADGFLGIIEDVQRLANLETNVARLRASFDQLEASFEAGRISSRLQVVQARQSLLNAQSSLLSSRAALQSRIDAFKTDVGLPPSLPVKIDEPFLSRFAVTDPASTRLQQQLSDLQSDIRRRDTAPTHTGLHSQLQALLTTQEAFAAQFQRTERDFDRFKEAVPRRKNQLVALEKRADLAGLSLEPGRLSPASVEENVGRFTTRLTQARKDTDDTFGQIKSLSAKLSGLTPEEGRGQLSELAAAVGSQLLELSLDQSAMRLELVELPEVSVSEQIALACAKTQRLDWMNARASLVDSWRQIEVDANPLMSGLDITLNGSLPNFDPEGKRFDGKDGQLRAGLKFDTPLDRIRERSAWRETLVDFQRSRRDYMFFEDRVSQSLRNTLRLISLSQLNFELRRVAVQVALSQVDLARLRLQEPPKPAGGTAGASAGGNQFGATTARDLVSALNDLLDSQNDFLSSWVGYHVLRMVLDYELGTMHLSPDGQWIEPKQFSDQTLLTFVAKPAVSPTNATPIPTKPTKKQG